MHRPLQGSLGPSILVWHGERIIFVAWHHSFSYHVNLSLKKALVTLHRVDTPITEHLKRFCAKFGEVYGGAPWRKIEIGRTANFSVILFLELKLLWIFETKKLAQTYHPCLQSTISSQAMTLVLLTLALRTMTCAMALLVPIESKLSSSPIQITIPYRLPTGS